MIPAENVNAAEIHPVVVFNAEAAKETSPAKQIQATNMVENVNRRKEAWNSRIEGFAMYRVMQKQRLLHNPLRELNIRKYSDIDKKEIVCRQAMERAQTNLADDPGNIHLQKIEKEAGAFEDRDHLFFLCPWSKELLGLIADWLGIENWRTKFSSWLHWLGHGFKKKQRQKFVGAAMAAVLSAADNKENICAATGVPNIDIPESSSSRKRRFPTYVHNLNGTNRPKPKQLRLHQESATRSGLHRNCMTTEGPSSGSTSRRGRRRAQPSNKNESEGNIESGLIARTEAFDQAQNESEGNIDHGLIARTEAFEQGPSCGSTSRRGRRRAQPSNQNESEGNIESGLIARTEAFEQGPHRNCQTDEGPSSGSTSRRRRRRAHLSAQNEREGNINRGLIVTTQSFEQGDMHDASINSTEIFDFNMD
ncbi:hypothetical protein RIF29_15230 [Crotalaria pallida]|uniref:Uncharacterized protein n=1 Tax=Crotalaria pallida TaxID=3830 RepID=A0AAN9FJS3_CROPI